MEAKADQGPNPEPHTRRLVRLLILQCGRRCLARSSVFAPLSGLIGFAPASVQLNDPISETPQGYVQGKYPFALSQAPVAGDQQRFRFGEFRLLQQCQTQFDRRSDICQE